MNSLSKWFPLICCIGALSALSACAEHLSQPQRESASSREASQEITIGQQLQLIVSKAELWKVAEETDTWGYAVTDLDQNGRLELVASECHGTGFYSSTRIFEVNEAGDSLLEYSTPFGEEDSQPDLLFASEYRAFSEDGAYSLLAEDTVKDGAADYAYTVSAMCLKDGALSCKTLSRRTEVYEYDSADGDTSLRVSFYDGDGNPISEESYHALIEGLYEAVPEYRFTIGWSDAVSLGEYSEEQIQDLLSRSYAAFSVSAVS